MKRAVVFSIIQKTVKIVLLSVIFILLLILGIIRTPLFGSFVAQIAETTVNRIENASLKIGSLQFSGFLTAKVSDVNLKHPLITVNAEHAKVSISLYSLLLSRKLVVTGVETKDAVVKVSLKSNTENEIVHESEIEEFFTGFDPSLMHLSVRQANLTNTSFQLFHRSVELDIKVQKFIGNLGRGSFLSDNMPGGNIFVDGAAVSVILPDNNENEDDTPFVPRFLLTFDPLKVDLNSSKFHLKDLGSELEIETAIGNINLTTQSLKIVEGIEVEHLKIVDTHTRLSLPKKSEADGSDSAQIKSKFNFNVKLKSGILENVSYTMGNLKSVNNFDPLNFNAEVISGVIKPSEVNVRPFYVKSKIDDVNIVVNQTKEVETLRTAFFMNRDSIDISGFFMETAASKLDFDANSTLNFSSLDNITASLNFRNASLGKSDVAFFTNTLLEETNFDKIGFETISLDLFTNINQGSFNNARINAKIDDKFHLNMAGEGNVRDSKINFNSTLSLFCNKNFFSLIDSTFGTTTQKFVPDSFRFSGALAGNADSIYTNSRISINHESFVDLSGWVANFETLETLNSNININNSVISVNDIYEVVNPKNRPAELQNKNISLTGNFLVENGKYSASVDFSSPFLRGNDVDAVFTRQNGESTPKQISANIGSVRANGKTLTTLLPKNILPAWLQLPREIELSGSFDYSNDNLKSKISAKTSSGNIEGNIAVNGVNATQKKVTTALIGNGLDLNDITTARVKANRTNLSLTAQLGLDSNKISSWQTVLDVDQAYISNIKHSLSLTGSGNDSLYDLQVSASGDYLIANIDTEIRHKQESIFATIRNFELETDLVKLGVQDSGKFFISTDIRGYINHKLNNENSKGELSFDKLNAQLNDFSVDLNGSKASFNNSIAAGVSFSWKSQFFNFEATSSQALNKTIDAIVTLAKTNIPFFTLNETTEPTENLTQLPNIKFSLAIEQIANMFTMHGITFNFGASIHSSIANDEIVFDAKIVDIAYNEFAADSLTLKMNYSVLERAKLNMQMYNIAAFEMVDGNLAVDAKIENKTGDWTISMKEAESAVERFFVAFSVKRDFSQIGSALVIKPTTNNFILNHQHWSADTLGFVKVGNNTIQEANLTLGSANRRLSLKRLGDKKNNPISIEMENFQLNDLFASVGAGEYLAANVGGFVRFYELRKGIPLFTAGLEIENIIFKEDTIGNLSVAAARDGLLYSANARLWGDKAVLDLFAVSDMNVSSTDVRGNINIEKIDLSKFGKYFGNIEANGILTGQLTFANRNGSPDVRGEILFNAVMFDYAPTQTSLKIDGQKMLLNQNNIILNSFTVKDSENNSLILNGNAELKNFDDPIELNISGLADNFILMNSTRRNNPNFWGKVIVSSNFGITGYHNLPTITGNVKLDEGSTLNMDLQAPQRAISQRRRILLFKDEYLEMALQEDAPPARERGVIVNVETEIDKDTRLVLYIDPILGGVLDVEGTGNFNVSYDQGGTFNITGAYEIIQGMYSMNIYRVINRTFSIREGSRIVWMGGPADAEADIVATHNLRASPEGIINQRGHPLPFSVNLNMHGNIAEPTFSFFLDMPINERNAYNGAVYSAISSINADESQLNMQVLSLLVAGRFLGGYAAPSEQTPQEVATREASMSAGKIFTQELNRMLERYITAANVSLDFENYGFFDREGQMQSRSEVNIEVQREFFDNRVSVKVGEKFLFDEAEMAEYSGFTGDVVVEYMLTADGRFRFSGYRKSDYGILTERNATKTGLKFIFDHSYD